ALLDQGAHACRREHAAQTAAAGTHALDECALRNQFDLDLSGDHLLLGLRIEADVTGDQPADQAFVHELADALAGPGGVVGDHREIALALAHQLVDHALRAADGHEAADHHTRAVGNEGDGILHRDSFHGRPSVGICSASAEPVHGPVATRFRY